MNPYNQPTGSCHREFAQLGGMGDLGKRATEFSEVSVGTMSLTFTLIKYPEAGLR